MRAHGNVRGSIEMLYKLNDGERGKSVLKFVFRGRTLSLLSYGKTSFVGIVPGNGIFNKG